MAIKGIEQPEMIEIDENLRLRKYTDDCSFALEWYQDEETLVLVDGANVPYDMEKLYRMYHYLQDRGEVYFIEVKLPGESEFCPVGDVTFWQDDMPIVIGVKELRGHGIGRKVVKTFVNRAKQLGFPYLEVAEIYHYNEGSRRMFESIGFRPVRKTEEGHTFRLDVGKFTV